MNVQAFSPNGTNTKSIAATASSAGVALAATDVGGNNSIRVYNLGPNVVFVRWGNGAQTALVTDMPIAAGTVEIFTKDPTTNNVAAICAATQTATVYFTCGEGQ